MIEEEKKQEALAKQEQQAKLARLSELEAKEADYENMRLQN